MCLVLMLELSGKMCGCISEEELLKNSEMESKTRNVEKKIGLNLNMKKKFLIQKKKKIKTLMTM